MEECESLDPEMTELQEDFSETTSQDDEDEVEELQKSLREVVQDQSVKPKFQCLMVDPSFSMVTVQSEDSGIVWETASSRCSTPWASETSSISDAYSMDGAGAAGKITIVFDEDKVIRRRTRSGGRSSRLGDRLSRHGSSRSASALGVERPEMAEISLPNIKQEKGTKEPDLEEIKNKDQQLFSLISEGYEILNIRVPSKLPTVDEEESTELQDNLSYLDETPKIKSRSHHEWMKQRNHVQPEENQELPNIDSESSADAELALTPTQIDSTVDDDYFEKFTLLDVAVPGEQIPDLQEVEEAQESLVKPQVEEQKPVKDTATESPTPSEESFVFVTDVDIVSEHLDEVFYGGGPPTGALQRKDDNEANGGSRMRTRQESQRSMKENGSVLFGSEETTLTPIYIPAGPPKIIDPILLEEPTAMSFMYSDLYEDAVGQRVRSDEEYSEAESVTSEKSYKRRFSDSDDADGYLEKFTLKDETPLVEVQPLSLEDKKEGRMMWAQSRFEMTGCLSRSVKEKTDEPLTMSDKVEEISKLKQTEEEALEKSIQRSEVMEDTVEYQEVEDEVKRGQTDPPSSSVNETLDEIQEVKRKIEATEKESAENQRGVEGTSAIKEEQPCQTTEVVEKGATDETAVVTPAQSEIMDDKPNIQTGLSGEAVSDTEMVVPIEERPNEIKAEEEARTSTGPLTEIKMQPEIFVSGPEEASEAIPEDDATIEVITDCDCAVQAVVEVTDKTVDEKDMHTQVQIDIQEVRSAESADVPAAEKQQETAEENQSPEVIAQADDGLEVTPQISSEIIETVMPGEGTELDEKCHEILEFPQHHLEESVGEPDKSLTTEVTAVLDKVDIGDELILLVPSGKVVEMDIMCSEENAGDAQVVTESQCEDLIVSEDRVVPTEETKTDSQLEEEPESVVVKVDELIRSDLDMEHVPPASPEPQKEPDMKEEKTDENLEEDGGVFSPLRSFTPQVDLSGLHVEDEPSKGTDVDEQKVETDKVEDATESVAIGQDAAPDIDQTKEDFGQRMEQHEVVTDISEIPTDDLDYEVISKQDAEKMPEPQTQRDAEEPRPEAAEDSGETMDVEVEEKGFDVSPEEEALIEADYDIIDAEEEDQAQLAAELQGMDWFCLTCGCLLSRYDCASGEHQNHEVNTVDKVYEEIKEKLSDWISELQNRSENIEDMVSELELAYNTVEDQYVESETAMQAQNEEMMAVVMEQYNKMSVSLEEEKKSKLERLYDQIVSFQESIETTKGTLETTAREAETDARSPEDIHERLKVALDSAMSLELGPKGLLVFEDYAKGNSSSSHPAQRKGIPAPQRPTLQPQEPGSASSTNVTVYWKVNPGDIIDCFQVYCMEDPQGAVSEEYRVTVKESYCALEELEPDKTYKVWVMAVNYTGCSLPSERLAFTTAPSEPVIDTVRCTVMWDSATLRWKDQGPGLSYTLEYCRQYELEGEGLRSICGIKQCEQKVLLQPNENYLFYIKAVNEAGASEQSEAALISTKGTKFCLLKATAHPALEVSVDHTTLRYSKEAHENVPDKQCPSILGESFPPRGSFYWETVVSGCPAYRLGVTYSMASRDTALGDDSLSWCLQCVPAPSGCRYQLLHSDVQSSVLVMDPPERVGVLLDCQLGRLSFYNAHSGQLLGSFSQRFTQPCHPALGLELPGSLQVCMVQEVPNFTKDS